MNPIIEDQVLSSKIIKTENIKWKELRFIQKEEFKQWFAAGDEKLLQSLLRYQFVDPFKVYESEPGVLYCLDGYHRYQDLVELEKKGVKVPDEFPATFIDCANMKEAAELVLVYSSVYARVSREGLSDFIEMNGIDMEDMKFTLDIPGITLPELPSEMENAFNDPGTTVKNQFGVIVMCTDEKQQEEIFNKLTEDGFTCKIVVT